MRQNKSILNSVYIITIAVLQKRQGTSYMSAGFYIWLSGFAAALSFALVIRTIYAYKSLKELKRTQKRGNIAGAEFVLGCCFISATFFSIMSYFIFQFSVSD